MQELSTIMNLQIVLNSHKNPYLNQASQKDTCQNFPTEKNAIENFKPPQNPYHPCHLSSGVPPPPPWELSEEEKRRGCLNHVRS